MGNRYFSVFLLATLIGLSSVSQQSMAMSGMYGPEPMSREASGTSWQPDLTPMEGHYMFGPWMAMLHATAAGIFTQQGGNRGGTDFFATSMLMGDVWRDFDPIKLGFRSMLTLEPLTIPEEGYREVLQTGETADGVTPLLDHQHPHDLFMELALTGSIKIQDDQSLFVYFGYPGEPALGPPAFMHRFSGIELQEAPISHHWIDSTHVTFGVATLGYIWHRFKIEGSIFTGQEPDQDRYDFDEPTFNSYSGRISYNPTEAWALQVSYGRINAPEQLAPYIDTDRLTASGIYHHSFENAQWQSTLAWGQDTSDPGSRLNAFLLESTLNLFKRHWFFVRGEVVEKDELFDFPITYTPLSSGAGLSKLGVNYHFIPFPTAPPSNPPPNTPITVVHPLNGQVYAVRKTSIGYTYDFLQFPKARLGIGGLLSFYVLPDAIRGKPNLNIPPGEGDFYNGNPTSFMVFARLKFD